MLVWVLANMALCMSIHLFVCLFLLLVGCSVERDRWVGLVFDTEASLKTALCCKEIQVSMGMVLPSGTFA